MTSAAAVVRDYYDALRAGDPLAPYFLPAESTVKFGIGEALFGYDEVAEALESQTETTADWTVESHRLEVAEDDAYATFADEVTMAWTDLESGEERRFETRWSGTLVPSETGDADSDSKGEPASAEPAWRFRSMHVSAPREL